MYTYSQKGEAITYNPKDYWEKRLLSKFNLSGVGNLSFNEYYNKFLYKAKIRTLKKALLSQNIDIHNKTVCDVGCGTGFFVDFYHFQGAKDIVGIDITNISVENLKRKYPKYYFVKEDICSSLVVSKINRQFDILNAIDVLYHIKSDKEFNQAIANISDLTKNNGLILLSDLYGSKNIDVAEHVRLRSSQIYQTTLGENSIVITIFPVCYLLNRPVFGLINKRGLQIDNLLAPIYFYLDKVFLSPTRSNLNLIVAKKVTA